MSDTQTHPYTGLPLSKTFLRHLEAAGMDIEELPDTVDDCDGEITDAHSQIEMMDQQIALESAGATRRSAKDPDWPHKVTGARIFFVRRRGVLVRWRKRLQAMETQKNPPDPIPAQMRDGYRRGLERQIRHFKKVNAEMNACMSGLKAVTRRLDDETRAEVYAQIEVASETLQRGAEYILPDDFWESAHVRMSPIQKGENSA